MFQPLHDKDKKEVVGFPDYSLDASLVPILEVLCFKHLHLKDFSFEVLNPNYSFKVSLAAWQTYRFTDCILLINPAQCNQNGLRKKKTAILKNGVTETVL